jgi:anti-sigma B factor antagonist
MKMQTRYSGQVAILELAGRFDNNTAPPVATWLEEVAKVPPAHVVVNMAQVHFVDSTGLATLVKGMRRCHEHAGELHICCLQQQVYMIFEFTRLDQALPVFVNEEHAVKAFHYVKS